MRECDIGSTIKDEGATGVRIIAGTAGGRPLRAPRGLGTRPTSDRVKESLFNVLAPRMRSGGAALDLFSGSGALGLEALSRGARRAVLVERDAEALQVIAQNVASTGLRDAVVLSGDVFRLWERMVRLGPYDLVTLDPPYGGSILQRILSEAPWDALLADAAWMAAEHKSDETLSPPDTLEEVTRRTYGRTALSFYRRRRE